MKSKISREQHTHKQPLQRSACFNRNTLSYCDFLTKLGTWLGQVNLKIISSDRICGASENRKHMRRDLFFMNEKARVFSKQNPRKSSMEECISIEK